MSPSILVVGAGAIGALFGSALARQGARVSVVCRSDYDAVRRGGYRIQSHLLGEYRFQPHQVFKEVSECTEPPDYLMLTVKVLPQLDRVALIRPAVGPNTVILLIQNGIDIEQEIAHAFPSNELLSSVAYIGVGRVGPGEIRHQPSADTLTLGRYPQGLTPAARSIGAMIEASGLKCRLTEDISSARWHKAVWNAVFNPLSVAGGVLDTATMLGTPEAREFVRVAMQEICAVAAAAGHPQPPRLIDQMITQTQAMPAYKTSMALDYENGRPLEIEAILGNVVRVGRNKGVAIPVLETLYTITKMVENQQARGAR
jgi:2-dehydropantoate 2-reductase